MTLILNEIASSQSGRTIVFLHGFLESSKMWAELDLGRLNARVLAIDLPGHGCSKEIPVGDPSVEAMAIEVERTLADFGVRAYSVVGHSMGGYVALELKRRSMDVEKVVLLNSNFWADSDQKKMDRKRVAEIVYSSKSLFLKEAIPNLFLDPTAHESEIEELINDASEMSPEAIAYASLAMSNREDLSVLLEQKATDFSLIQGEGDKIIPLEMMLERLPLDFRSYFVIQGSGHMTHIEKPDDLMVVLGQLFE